jgi:hypothetical protein
MLPRFLSEVPWACYRPRKEASLPHTHAHFRARCVRETSPGRVRPPPCSFPAHSLGFGLHPLVPGVHELNRSNKRFQLPVKYLFLWCFAPPFSESYPHPADTFVHWVGLKRNLGSVCVDRRGRGLCWDTHPLPFHLIGCINLTSLRGRGRACCVCGFVVSRGVGVIFNVIVVLVRL